MGGQKAKPGSQQQSSNPEAPKPYVPDDSYYTHIDGAEDPETVAERHEAGAMDVKGKSKRARADVSLESLKERAESRNYDQETVDKINKINFFESPEAQEENFAALREVSTILVSLALRADPKRDFSQLSNFENFASALPATQPAENAAIHKIRELISHGDSDVSKHFKQEWTELVHDASLISSEIQALQEADFKGKEKPGVVSKAWVLAKKHPLISLGIMLAGAACLYKIFSSVRDRLPSSSSGEKKEGGGIFKWVAGIGIAVASLFAFGKLAKMKGIQDFFKKNFDWNLEDNRVIKALTLISQGKFKEAGETLWEGVDDNKKLHTEMAKVISDEMKTPVSGKTLFELKDETFEDFISRKAQLKDAALLKTAGFVGDWVEYLPGIDSAKKNQEQIAVRGFLKKHESTIRDIMAVREDTTLEEVLIKLGKHLGGKTALAAGAAGGVAAGASAEGSPDAKGVDQSRTRERDKSIDKLSIQEKKARAIENEKILAEKISLAEIERAREAIDEREKTLRNLLTDSLKPAEREEVEEKIATLEAQEKQFNELADNHTKAYAAYELALRNNVDEDTMIERFEALVESKELVEEQIEDIFARDGWTVIAALALTHGKRFGGFVWRRWIKAGDIRTEQANYLFDKLKGNLSFEKLREKLRDVRKRNPARRAKPPNISVLKGKTDDLFRDMNGFVDDVYTGSQGIAAEGLNKEHFRGMDQIEQRVSEQQDHLDSLWKAKNNELRDAIKAGNTGKQNKLLQEIAEVGNERVRLEHGTAREISGLFERWIGAHRGVGGKPDIEKKGIAAFRGFFLRALRVQRKHEVAQQGASAISKVMMKNGGLVFLGASVLLRAAPTIAAGEILTDEKTGRTEAYSQAVLSALPIAGTYLDFYSAATGQEKLTGRKLDMSDRVISGLFGVAGLATDALTVFGIGVAGRGVLIGLKAGRGMAKAARVAKVVDATKDAKAAARAYRGAQVLEQAGKWGFRVTLGTAVLGVPASIVYQEKFTLPVSETFQREVLDGIDEFSGAVKKAA